MGMNWISVKDKLPLNAHVVIGIIKKKSSKKRMIDVLIFFKNSNAQKFKYDFIALINSTIYHHEVTHWMPLPELPK